MPSVDEIPVRKGDRPRRHPEDYDAEAYLNDRAGEPVADGSE